MVRASSKQGKTDAFDKQREGTGTREWSEHSCNIGVGCSHDCLYCYARQSALRFKKISSPSEWPVEKIGTPANGKAYGKKSGTIMFPTSHDITPFYLKQSIEALEKLLANGNMVLLVSKPHIKCVKEICRHLTQYRETLLLRFTITTTDEDTSVFWEPGAPKPEERLRALANAFSCGFRTSVSIEPMLRGADDAILTATTVMPYVTDTVWVGKMNKPRLRVDITKPENLAAVEEIERLQADSKIIRLTSKLRHDKIRWKDSVKAVIGAAT